MDRQLAAAVFALILAIILCGASVLAVAGIRGDDFFDALIGMCVAWILLDTSYLRYKADSQ